MDNRKRIGVLIGVIVALVLCVCCCGSVVGFVALDPLQLHWLDMLFGGDPVSRAIPADAQAVLSVDFLNLASQNTTGIIKAFTTATNNNKIQNFDDFIRNQIDDPMEKSTGVNFTDDIKPWIGQHAGIAVFGNISLTAAGSNASKMVFLVETRNQKKTDDFITKLMNGETKNSKSPGPIPPTRMSPSMKETIHTEAPRPFWLAPAASS